MSLDAISRLIQQRQAQSATSAAQPAAQAPSAAQPIPLAQTPSLPTHDVWSGPIGRPRLVPIQELLGHGSAPAAPAPVAPAAPSAHAGVQTEPGVSAATARAIASVPGQAWAGKLASNGNREAAILMPQGFDPSKPTEVIFYFHGHDNTIAGVLTNKDFGLGGTMTEMAKTRNLVFVVPQGPPSERDSTWMNAKNKESLGQFQQDIFARIEKMAPGTQIQSVTLKGHSAGGLPLLNGATAGGIRADKVDFLDASYGYWASETYNQLKKHGQHPPMSVTYIPGTKTEADASRLKGAAGVSLKRATVGHSAVPKTYLANG